MKKEKMVQRLQKAYKKPDEKFCYYTGQANPEVSKALGVSIWDWTPQKTVNIEPYYWNTHTLALAFGCKQIFTSEGKEWVGHMIHSLDEIENIQLPSTQSGRTGEILQLIKKLLAQHPKDTLIRLPDIQSPLGVAELMLGESLYEYLLIYPDKVHLLLEKITEFTVSYIREIKNICGNRLNASCHPQVWSNESGYYLSDDANSMVSPEMHMEFSIKYINKMTELLGPVIYHSCTWTDAYIPNIRKVKNKKLVNWSTGTSNPPHQLISENAGKVIMCPHIGKNTHTETGITSLGINIINALDLIKYYLDSMTDNSTLYMVLQEDLFEDISLFKKIYQLFDDYGYSPEKNGYFA